MTKEFKCPKCQRYMVVGFGNLKWTKTGRTAWCSVCGEYTLNLVHVVKKPERDRPKHQSKKERLRLRKEQPCQK